MRNYYLLVINAVFICGALLASFGIFKHVPIHFFVISFIVLLATLILFLKIDFLFVILLFLLVFLLGAIRYNTFNLINKNHIKNFTPYLQEKVLLRGKVVSDPEEDRRNKGITFTLETSAKEGKNHWRKVNGLVLVNLKENKMPLLLYGDILLLEGMLKRPFSYRKRAAFDYSKYLADRRIYSILKVKGGFLAKKIGEDKSLTVKIKRVIYSIRAKLQSQIESSIDMPYSSVLTAILLGKRQNIPAVLNDLFAKTGTLHILAISGLHVGIIYFALRVILKIFRIRKNTSVVLSILFLFFFAILTGAMASILRATTMFSIFGFGEILKRRISIYNVIGLSSLIILIANPNQIFDVGFILSYAAVLSIVYISPMIYGIFSAKSPLKYYLLRSVSVSLAAWVGLLPLIAYYFGLISPIVVIANLIVIPLLFVLMGSGILLLALGFLSEFLAKIFAQSAWFFTLVLIKATRFLKDIPFSHFEISKPQIYTILAYYILLFVATRAFKAKN